VKSSFSKNSIKLAIRNVTSKAKYTSKNKLKAIPMIMQTQNLHLVIPNCFLTINKEIMKIITGAITSTGIKAGTPKLKGNKLELIEGNKSFRMPNIIKAMTIQDIANVPNL